MGMFDRFDKGEPAFMFEFMRDPSRIDAPCKDARHQDDERGEPEGSLRKKIATHESSLSRPILISARRMRGEENPGFSKLRMH